MVTSKHSQLLQNRHFAETLFGVFANIFSYICFCRTNFLGVEKSNVGDHLKHVFPKFEADQTHPWGVNGRSKFRKKNRNFKRLKNREVSSDLDENLIELIAATQTFIWKSFRRHTGSKNTFSNFFSREPLYFRASSCWNRCNILSLYSTELISNW